MSSEDTVSVKCNICGEPKTLVNNIEAVKGYGSPRTKKEVTILPSWGRSIEKVKG